MAYCSKCGSELNADAGFCSNCGEAVAASPAAAPGPAATSAPAPQAPSEPDVNYSGFGRRFSAHLIDLFIVLIAYLFIGSYVAARVGGVTDDGFELEGGPAVQVMMLTALFALIYFTLAEAYWHGQTLGKKFLHIQVTRLDGSPCGFGPALLRNLLRIVDAFAFYLVGIILILTSQQSQRLGDRLAHTVVVRKAPRHADATASDKGKLRFSMGVRRGSDFID